MSNLKLREVIKQIRQCKTAAEERAVISKESALIRNEFKVRRRLHGSYSSDLLIIFRLYRKRNVSIGIGILPNCCSSTCLATPLTSDRLSASN